LLFGLFSSRTFARTYSEGGAIITWVASGDFEVAPFSRRGCLARSVTPAPGATMRIALNMRWLGSARSPKFKLRLRRRLRVHADPTDKDRQANAASWRALHLRERDVWLAEHSGRKAKDYWDNLDGEVLEWRSAGNMASLEAERQAWLADHPSEEYPEHECGLSGREYTDLARWRRQRERRLARSTTTLQGRGGGGPGV
jgi:hypothetical protein